MSDNSDDVEKRRGRRIALIFIFCLFALFFGPLILGGLHNWLGPSKILTALTTGVLGLIYVLWALGSIPALPLRDPPPDELDDLWAKRQRERVARGLPPSPPFIGSNAEDTGEQAAAAIKSLLRARDEAAKTGHSKIKLGHRPNSRCWPKGQYLPVLAEIGHSDFKVGHCELEDKGGRSLALDSQVCCESRRRDDPVMQAPVL